MPPWLDFFVATDVAAVINVSILILILGAAINLGRAWRRLKAEEDAATRLRTANPERGDVIALLGSVKGTLAAGRIEILRAQQAERKPQAALGEKPGLNPEPSPTVNLKDASNLVTMAAAADSEELHQEVALARAVAAAVVLLGLGGTLVGLSIGLAPLVEVFQGTQSAAPNLQGLWSAMNDSVAGMRTAFSTTLSGVLGALVLGSAVAMYGRKQGRVLTTLERACLLVVLPAFGEDESSGLSEAVAKMEQLRKEFKSSFSALTEDLKSRGAALSKEMIQGFEDVTGEVIHGFNELIGPFEEVRDATLTLIGTPEEGAEPLARQVERLGEAAGELERSVESATRLIPELRDTLIESFREQSEATRQALDHYYGRMAAQVEEQAESTRQLSEEVRRTASSVGSVADSISGFVTAAEDYRQVWKEVANTVREAESALDTRLGAMKHAVEAGVSELIRKQGNVQQRVLTSLTQFETQLGDSIETIERERRRAVSRSEELIRELREAVKDAIREIDARGEGQQEQLGSALRQGLRELQLELRDLLIAPGRQRSPGVGDGRLQQSSAPSEGQARVQREPEAANEDRSIPGRRDLLERAFGSEEEGDEDASEEPGQHYE